MAILILVVQVLILGNGSAVHDDNMFELGPALSADILGDGNAANGPDWADIFDGSGNFIGATGLGSFIADDLSQASAVDDTTYSGAGGSNKNNDQIGQVVHDHALADTWHWDAGNVPAKDDLSNAYTYAKFGADEHLLIFAGFERIDSSGDSHIDFEFFQKVVELDETEPCNDPGVDPTPCHFVGARTVNDIIVSMDFQNGGAFGSITIRKWDGTQYVLVESIAGEGCNAADTICGFNNGGAIDGGPWPNYDRHGAVITTLPKNGLTEYGIDMTALTGKRCVTSVLGKTRSSASFTAELKDFVGPFSFPICGADIKISGDAVNEVGDEHTFNVNVDKILAGVSSPADDGTIVAVALIDSNGAVSTVVSDGCASVGTVGGACSITFVSYSAGLVKGHASADVTVFGESIHVETNGAGNNSGDAVKQYVDAQIDLSPLVATNEVNDPHVVTATVLQDDGLAADQGGDGVSGWASAPDGTLVTFSMPFNSAGASFVGPASGLTAGGSTSATITAATPGVVSISATTTFSVGGVPLTRASGSGGLNSADAQKVYVDARISIDPTAVNQVGDPHTFTVTVEENDGLGGGFVPADGEDVDFVLAASNGAVPVVDAGASSCDDAGANTDSSGQCTIVFTSYSGGLVEGTASSSVQVGGISVDRSTDGAGGNSGPAVKRFVAARLTLSPAQDANQVGDEHIISAHLEIDYGSGAGFVDAPAGETIDFAIDSGPGSLSVSSCVTTIDGVCYLGLTSSSTGLTQVSALWSGVVATAEGSTSASAEASPVVKRWVDARLSLAPSSDANRVGDSHVITATLEFDYGNGAGFIAAPDGETISFTIDSGPGSLSASSCVTAGGGGSCSVVLISLSTGLTSVSASWGGWIATAEGSANASAASGPVVKRWVDAMLMLSPPQAANQVGDDHEITADLRFDTGSGFENAPDGEIIQLSIVSGPGSLSAPDCTTSGGTGSCSVTLTSATTGLTAVAASWDGVIATVEGTTVASADASPAVKRWVDARLALSPASATNRVGDDHEITATLEFDNGDGAGFVAAPDGQTISLSIDSGPGSLSSGTCVTSGGGGSCSVVLTSAAAGLTTISASWTGSIATAEGTASASTGASPVVKRWVDVALALNPPQAANQIGSDHEITATLRFDTGSGFENAPDGEIIQLSIVSGPGSLSAPSCATSGGTGSCSVTLTSGLTGLSEVAASWNGVVVTVEGSTSTSEDAEPVVKRWVDAHLALEPASDTNRIGDSHVITATLRFDYGDGTGFVAAPDGEIVSLSIVSGPGSLSSPTCVTSGGGGSCSVILSSGSTGLTSISASWSGSIATAEGSASASTDASPVVKRWADVRLTLSPPQAANQVGSEHTITAHLEFDTGSGFVNAPDTELIQLSLVSGPGVLSPDSCLTAGGTGSCSVSLLSGVTGLSVVSASWTGVIGTVEGTTSATEGAHPVVKRWVDARLALSPASDTNRVGDEHKVTATLEFDYGDGSGFAPAPGGETISFQIDSGPGSLSSPTCVTAGGGGSCSVVLSSPTTGLTTVSASWSGSIATAEGSASASTDADPVVKRWADVRLDLSPPSAANQVGSEHLLTAHLEFDTGAGFGNAPDGELIQLSLVSGPGVLTPDSCLTAGGTGSCSVSLSSTATGLSVVSASWNGVVTTVEGSASASEDSAPAVKRWVDARLALDPSSATNRVGDDHEITATLEFDYGDGAGFVSAPDGESVSFVVDSGPGSLSAASCTTSGGTCSVLLSSATTGLTTVSASWSGSIATAEGTTSASTDADQVVKRWADVRLELSPPRAANEVGDDHVMTAHLEIDSGAGFGNAPDGEIIQFSLVSGPGSLSSASCTTAGGTGSCSVTLSSASTGLSVVSASWNGVISTAEGTTSVSAGSGPVVKRWVDAVISVEPDGDNPIHTTHTFTVSLRIDYGDGAGYVAAPDGTSITGISLAGVGSIDSETCSAPGTVGGVCQVTISSAVPGVSTLTASWNGDVATSEGVASSVDAGSDDAVKTWWSGSISVTKRVEFGAFTTSATVCFELARTDGVLYTTSTNPQCAAFSPATPDHTFAWAGLTAGTYSVTESVTAPYSPMVPNPIDGIVVGSEQRDVDLGTVLNPLPPGRLLIEKRDQNGNLWSAFQVTFEVYWCGADLDCSTLDGLVATISIPGDGNPVSLALAEGRYLVREIVPAGYAALPSDRQVVDVVAGQSSSVSFQNIPRGEGCTPGFWKTHPEFWNGYAPDVTTNIQTYDRFNTVLGVSSWYSGLSSSTTLLQAMSAAGSALMALNRHTAAALANADSGINYPYTVAQVVAMYKDAVGYTAGPETIASLHAKLQLANELGCPYGTPLC